MQMGIVPMAALGMMGFCYLTIMLLCCVGIAYGNYYIVKKSWFPKKPSPMDYQNVNIKEDTDVVIEEVEQQDLM